MNWVGGSRSRYIQNKEDTLKQRAFFQKQRMKSKSNNMDLPKARNSGNMDLLTLFIVNQIASKKEPQSVQSNTGKTKINQMIGAKRTKKGFNEHFSNEFPMSPCLPSNLNLVTSLPKYSADTPGFKTRKYRLSEEFKFKLLSPVIESNLSDTSGSENQGQPSQASNVPSDPVKPKPTQHIPSSLPSSPDNMKLSNPWPDVSNEAHMEDVPHSSLLVGIGFENTLLNQEMGEHSATSALYPLSSLKSSQQPEEPLFIDFKNTDCEVLASLTDNSQHINNDGHFLKQEFICTDSNSCADGGNVFMRAYESSRGVYLSVDDTEAQMHDGNPPIILDAETQTEVLTYRDVSVQCSLIHHSDSKSLPAARQESGILTTRRRSFNANPFLKFSSLIDGHKTIGNSSSGPSATHQHAQRHPKSQTGLSSRRLRRQKGMKREVTSVLKHSLPKASEEIKQQRWQCKVKIERCDDPRLDNVTRNVRRETDEDFTAEKGVNRVSVSTAKLQEADDMLLM